MVRGRTMAQAGVPGSRAMVGVSHDSLSGQRSQKRLVRPEEACFCHNREYEIWFPFRTFKFQPNCVQEFWMAIPNFREHPTPFPVKKKVQFQVIQFARGRT